MVLYMRILKYLLFESRGLEKAVGNKGIESMGRQSFEIDMRVAKLKGLSRRRLSEEYGNVRTVLVLTKKCFCLMRGF